MKLIKTSIFSGLITIIRLISGFIVMKFIAFFTGPSGIALLGGFQNFISIILTFGNGAINNGVVKYSSEYSQNEIKTKKLLSTSFRITFISSLIISLILILFSNLISNIFFNNSIYTLSIRLLGITLILYTTNILFTSILNGRGQIKKYTIVNIFGSLVGLIFTLILVYLYNTEGALISLVLSQTIVLLITILFIRKQYWFKKEFLFGKFDKNTAKRLSRYSMMSIVSALTIPTTQIILRNLVTNKLSINDAGQWQGMLRVSDSYLLLITTSLTTYYLPKLSSLKTSSQILKEILYGYKIILPIVILFSFFIYLFRFWIIKLLYSSEFIGMEKLFLVQLVGDIFKISSWILGYVLVAKAKTKIFISLEIIFSILYVTTSYFFLEKFNLIGISYAYAFNYLFFLIIMIIIFKNILKKI